jgi:hypothetical protein
MVEIRYGEQYEMVDLAGQTIGEAREQFRSEFGIPEKATARLNGSKVKGIIENETVLHDDDKLTFAVPRGKGIFLVGAMLLALAVTSSAFAFGFINDTVTLNASAAGADFASVTANTSSPLTWSTYGFFKGSISGPNTIFDVDTATSGYTGDLVVTVSMANAADLVKAYRVLSLTLEMVDDSDNPIDINEDSIVDDADIALLTLGNGSVDMFPDGSAGNMHIRVKSGFYITHILGTGWGAGAEDPVLFAEVAQRGS